ncbi:hypothetical protein [Sphingomonas sp. Leaf38]|uniref:hypothetical protein n=1 Tax=Sphingomonas sp. Leaf38 TaxID=1736217 RepID=UPI0006FBD5B3|nr:hypothetical protein [Sphingomonas sp. Leaf38]KQN33612.1 hypothetical protein ASE88_00845 [Sphingomonas sp. Leaf38]
MKIVNLIGPAVIAGAVRYPVEGALTVSDVEAEQLKESGRLDGDPENLPDDEEEDDGLEALKADDLKSLAQDEGITLGTANTKPAMVAAIRAARAA